MVKKNLVNSFLECISPSFL